MSEPTLTVLKPMTPERAGELLTRLDDSLSRNITKEEARSALDAFLRAHETAADLLAAMEAAAKSCRCRGTGVYTKDCTRCGDSTYDHACNDEERPCELPPCVAVRAAISRATGR